MDSFIQELYLGNINPRARSAEFSDRYDEVLAIIEKNEVLLGKALKDNERKIFLEFINAWDDLLAVTSCDTFANGFRTGASFSFDTFVRR